MNSIKDFKSRAPSMEPELCLCHGTQINFPVYSAASVSSEAAAGQSLGTELHQKGSGSCGGAALVQGSS